MAVRAETSDEREFSAVGKKNLTQTMYIDDLDMRILGYEVGKGGEAHVADGPVIVILPGDTPYTMAGKNSDVRVDFEGY
jgi:hypothetical protein